MGKMKEIYMDLQQGYEQELKIAYANAVQNNNDVVYIHGRQISKAYAEYLLHFQETFLNNGRSLASSNQQNDTRIACFLHG